MTKIFVFLLIVIGAALCVFFWACILTLLFNFTVDKIFNSDFGKVIRLYLGDCDESENKNPYDPGI